MRTLLNNIIRNMKNSYNVDMEDVQYIASISNVKNIEIKIDGDDLFITNTRSKTQIIVNFYGENYKNDSFYGSISSVEMYNRYNTCVTN